jgi:hypothetical protein
MPPPRHLNLRALSFTMAGDLNLRALIFTMAGDLQRCSSLGLLLFGLASVCDGFACGIAPACGASRASALSQRRALILNQQQPSPGDRSVLEAVGALKRGMPVEAAALLKKARDAYKIAGGPSTSQLALLEEVDLRVQRAIVAQPAARPDDPLAGVRTLPGDYIVQEALSLFNAKEFEKAREAIYRARASFAAEGADVARDREVTVGNLYSLISREEERETHMKKLLKLKKFKQLKEQKDRAARPPGL